MTLPTIELPQHYLFSSLDATQCRKVEKHSHRKHLTADEQLFAQDDPADCFWWLEHGQIKLYRLSRDGHQKIMGLVTPRQSFAEGILFMDTPRYPVNATAVTAATVLGFERDAYLSILETSFATCRTLFRQMVRRTQRHLDEIEALTIQNARFRLVNYLLHLQRTAGEETMAIKLPARKALIASQLSMQPETLSRLFRELEQAGLIRVQGDIIGIVDVSALERTL